MTLLNVEPNLANPDIMDKEKAGPLGTGLKPANDSVDEEEEAVELIIISSEPESDSDSSYQLPGDYSSDCSSDSDAYLSCQPSKRRKPNAESKPRGDVGQLLHQSLQEV